MDQYRRQQPIDRAMPPLPSPAAHPFDGGIATRQRQHGDVDKGAEADDQSGNPHRTWRVKLAPVPESDRDDVTDDVSRRERKCRNPNRTAPVHEMYLDWQPGEN